MSGTKLPKIMPIAMANRIHTARKRSSSPRLLNADCGPSRSRVGQAGATYCCFSRSAAADAWSAGLDISVSAISYYRMTNRLLREEEPSLLNAKNALHKRKTNISRDESLTNQRSTKIIQPGTSSSERAQRHLQTVPPSEFSHPSRRSLLLSASQFQNDIASDGSVGTVSGAIVVAGFRTDRRRRPPDYPLLRYRAGWRRAQEAVIRWTKGSRPYLHQSLRAS